MSSNPPAKRAITRISTERQLLQMFGAGLTPADLADILDTAEIRTVKAGEAILTEGDLGNDIYVIRVGSMIVEKKIGGKNVFLSYLPAGRSEEHTSELQSLMRISYAVFCLKKK